MYVLAVPFQPFGIEHAVSGLIPPFQPFVHVVLLRVVVEDIAGGESTLSAAADPRLIGKDDGTSLLDRCHGAHAPGQASSENQDVRAQSFRFGNHKASSRVCAKKDFTFPVASSVLTL